MNELKKILYYKVINKNINKNIIDIKSKPKPKPKQKLKSKPNIIKIPSNPDIITKYVVCKPRDGMIDIFGYIVASLKYAIKFNRILVIDTRKSLHFKDGFYKYFSTNNKNIYIPNDLDIFYDSLKNKSYSDIDPFRCPNISYNPFTNHTENIILFGNKYKNILDKDIIYFMKNFSIKEIVLSNLKEKYNLLPNNYISIHIRNTDYKSNIDSFIKKNYDIFNNKSLFIASDDYDAVNIFKKKFKNVYNFTFDCQNSDEKIWRVEHLKNKNKGIHYIDRNDYEHTIFNIDTITDFLLLAMSKNYYFSHHCSGFSHCAKKLFDEKNIISNIINCL